MKISTLALAGLSGLALSTSALADDTPTTWVGLGFGTIEHDFSYPVGGIGKETDDINARIGSRLSPWLSMEFRVGKTVGEATSDRGGIDRDFRHNHWVGGYLRGNYRAASFEPYVQLGYVRIKETSTRDGDNQVASDSDLSWAVGSDWFIKETVSLNLEFLQLADGASSDNTRRGYMVGAAWHF